MEAILTTKLEKFLEISMDEAIKTGPALLLSGDLLGFEQQLKSLLNELYDGIVQKTLQAVGTSPELKAELEKLAAQNGLGQLKKRTVGLQVATGSWLEFESYYAYQKQDVDYEGTRHLSLLYWGCMDKASPAYYSLVSMASVICPSFEIARQILDYQSIKTTYQRMRKLSLYLGQAGRMAGPVALLEAGESLEGKRVVIQLDGGRSRTREDKDQVSQKGYPLYDTPWKEPKMFVIQTLNDKGEVERKTVRPFYGGTMEDYQACLEELKLTLQALRIDLAKGVQFVADGARTIWKNIRSLLIDAGVKPKKIILSLDYYHAVEHLSDLVKLLQLEEPTTKKLLNKWKDWLWNGFARSILDDFKKQLRATKQQLTEEMKTALNYFKKHHDHMQYSKFRRAKWLCGSGLIESAIRRIINLRFKATSSFWKPDNLQQLILLRCAFLATRWDFLIQHTAYRFNELGTK